MVLCKQSRYRINKRKDKYKNEWCCVNNKDIE